MECHFFRVDIVESAQCLYKPRTIGSADGATRSEVFVTSMNETIIRFLHIRRFRGLCARSAAKVGLLYGISLEYLKFNLLRPK